jgi:hypothetical protein
LAGKEGDMAKLASRAGVSLRQILFMAALAASCASASAQPWTERPYNPPAGSRWSIVAQTDSEETRAGGERRDRHINMRSELTIDEKTPTGFKISYVVRDMAVTGNAPGMAVMQTAFGAMKDIVVRGRADPSGKPFVVDNLEEVKDAMRIVVERIVKSFESKPQAATVLKEMLVNMFVVDGSEAARLYMEELPVLSAGQNTGLKPGDTRREDEKIDSPLGGGAIKSVLISRLTAWDETTGKAFITRKREMDAQALKEATLALTQRIMSAAPDKATPQMLEQLKDIKFTLENEAVIEVHDGMARRVDDRTFMNTSLAGQTMTKIEKKVVTVAPLAK